HRALLLGVLRVDVGDDGPRHTLDRLPLAQDLRQLHLDRVHVADVVHDDADGALVAGTAGGAPFRVGKSFRERGQSGRSLLDTISQKLSTPAHVDLRWMVVWR